MLCQTDWNLTAIPTYAQWEGNGSVPGSLLLPFITGRFIRGEGQPLSAGRESTSRRWAADQRRTSCDGWTRTENKVPCCVFPVTLGRVTACSRVDTAEGKATHGWQTTRRRWRAKLPLLTVQMWQLGVDIHHVLMQWTLRHWLEYYTLISLSQWRECRISDSVVHSGSACNFTAMMSNIPEENYNVSVMCCIIACSHAVAPRGSVFESLWVWLWVEFLIWSTAFLAFAWPQF